MKRLHFRYEMQLYMSWDVTDHHFLFRLKPMEDGLQSCEEFVYQIAPADTVDEVWDGFGNLGYSGAVRRSHDQMTAVSQGVVLVNREKPACEECHPMYRFPSRYTAPDGRILGLCREAMAQADQGMELVSSMMDRLYRSFSYEPGITTVRTTAAGALKGGAGVCQDYAHILISMCRLVGIPARYVAGMMAGEGASHAWVEAWLDGAWIGVDPTHGRVVDETYIKLAHGRDFGDGAIDKGCFIGSATQRQQIYVKVEEVK